MPNLLRLQHQMNKQTNDKTSSEPLVVSLTDLDEFSKQALPKLTGEALRDKVYKTLDDLDHPSTWNSRKIGINHG
jgi:hypothetical protein